MDIHQRMPTQLGEKMALALRVAAKRAPLGVARRSFRPTKLGPRALIDALLVTTGAIKLV